MKAKTRMFGEIDIQEDPQGWQKWLRHPCKDKDKEDPYPAKFDQ